MKTSPSFGLQLLCMITLLAPCVGARENPLTPLSTPDNVAPLFALRVGPVTLPEGMRAPFANEVGAPGLAQRTPNGPLPGLTFDTSFACSKWFSQGPGLSTNGDLNISAQAHPTSGGVSAIAPHPTNPNTLYIGMVNGGVWRSYNATSNNVLWVPLTDAQP